MSVNPWIAQRTERFDSSGIRRMFALAAKVKDPINLSIGQPDFPVPAAVKQALIQAIEKDHNGYTPTEGIPALRQKIQASIDKQYGHPDRRVIITSGTSGGLVLALMGCVNPGDEVIFFDPYFVMYPAIVELAGGRAVKINTYPDFRIDAERLEAAITPRTKMILLNSPGNPTGVCYSAEEVQAVAEVAQRHNICLVSDEIYSQFSFDGPHHSPATYNDQTIVIDGFSKSHAMTGLRVGLMHGPSALMEVMAKLQQFTFVCAPAPVQWACLTACDLPPVDEMIKLKQKRDWLLQELGNDYEIANPGGAFYLFPKLPWGDGQSFIEAAVSEQLLVIPGNIFSDQDTHFRISYAVDERTLERGAAALKKLARTAVGV